MKKEGVLKFLKIAFYVSGGCSLVFCAFLLFALLYGGSKPTKDDHTVADAGFILEYVDLDDKVVITEVVHSFESGGGPVSDPNDAFCLRVDGFPSGEELLRLGWYQMPIQDRMLSRASLMGGSMFKWVPDDIESERYYVYFTSLSYHGNVSFTSVGKAIWDSEDQLLYYTRWGI